MVDLLLTRQPLGLVLNVENPLRQSWPNLCNFLAITLGLDAHMPFDKWLNQVQCQDKCPEGLIDFLRYHFTRMSGGSLVLDTEACVKLSPSLRDAGPVSEETIRLYIEKWQEVGFL